MNIRSLTDLESRQKEKPITKNVLINSILLA